MMLRDMDLSAFKVKKKLGIFSVNIRNFTMFVDSS